MNGRRWRRVAVATIYNLSAQLNEAIIGDYYGWKRDFQFPEQNADNLLISSSM